MEMDIKINIETVKSHINLTKTTEELQTYYKVILDEIRDLELKREENAVDEKIAVLEEILDMIGHMLLTAGADC